MLTSLVHCGSGDASKGGGEVVACMHMKRMYLTPLHVWHTANAHAQASVCRGKASMG
jgi:hypothetical protein